MASPANSYTEDGVLSGVVVKIVLPRWQKGVRGRGAVLGGMVWATPRVLASKIFRFFYL